MMDSVMQALTVWLGQSASDVAGDEGHAAGAADKGVLSHPALAPLLAPPAFDVRVAATFWSTQVRPVASVPPL